MSDIFVTQPSMPDFDEYTEILKNLWQTKYLTNMGKYHKIFQDRLRDFLETDNIELFVNGHMAIELSLQAFNFPPGTEIITTPFTFASTTHAIVRNNLKPVFCDIDPENFTLDAGKIENLITKKTAAIMPVHVYGNICAVEKISVLAEKYNLKIIYDAAHAFGEKYKGKSVANFGDVSCFSFHSTKVFHSIEGGAACFRDKKSGRKLYHLKNFGISGPENVDGIGANAKMNEFCAAMGICNLKNFERDISAREKIYRRYIENLDGIAGLKLNFIPAEVKSNYGYFPVIFNPEICGATRDKVFADLENIGVHARKYFYPLTNAFDCYKGIFNPKDTPTALKISDRVLTLPIYPNLPEETVDKICEEIRRTLGKL